MYQEMFAHTRSLELAAAERIIDQRIAVEEFSRIDRLQRALDRARAHMGWPAAPVMGRN